MKGPLSCSFIQVFSQKYYLILFCYVYQRRQIAMRATQWRRQKMQGNISQTYCICIMLSGKRENILRIFCECYVIIT